MREQVDIDYVGPEEGRPGVWMVDIGSYPDRVQAEGPDLVSALMNLAASLHERL